MTNTPTKPHEGTVVGVAGDKLTTTCSEGKEHCHTVAKDAKVTCDGKASKAADLKPGTPVQVTQHNDDKTVATAVTSGTPTPQAIITKVDPTQGTVTVKLQSDGKEVERTFELAEDIEYVDSLGNYTTIEFFTSGDLVLIVEEEGMLTSIKKNDATCDGASHDGKVVSVVGDKLTTSCNEGKQHCYTLAKDAKVTSDGKVSKAADLKPGTVVRVTRSKDDNSVATAVESGKLIPAPAPTAALKA